MPEKYFNLENVMENLSEEVKSKARELEEKIGRHPLSTYVGTFNSLAPEISEKAGDAEVNRVCSGLIDLMFSHLEHVPEHEETGYEGDVIQDFHHGVTVPGNYYKVTVPAHWAISRDGMSIIQDYISKLHKTYPVRRASSPEYLATHLACGEKLSNKELSIIYEESSSVGFRRRAGRELGYSGPRIFAHEHPVAATVTGIAAAGAAAGLFYRLFQYLSK